MHDEEPRTMRITKQEIVDIIKDEIEQMKRELGDELSSCMSRHKNIDQTVDDRLRPEQGNLPSDTIEEKDGRSRPRKTLAQKAKSAQKYKKRQNKERFRKAVLGGEAVMDTLGLREEEIEEEKKKKKSRRGNKNKPSKTRTNCTVGNPFHGGTDERGRFVSPSKAKGSWSLSGEGGSTGDCAKGQYRRKAANKATTFVSTCGRKGREKGTNIKCSTGKVEEGWRRFLNEARQEDERYRLEGGDNITGDQLRAAIKREMQKLLTNYEKWVGENQHKVIQNTRGLDDAKLSTYCDSFGFTSFRDYLTKTNALNVIVNNVIATKDKLKGQQQAQQPTKQDMPQTNPYEGGAISPSP